MGRCPVRSRRREGMRGRRRRRGRASPHTMLSQSAKTMPAFTGAGKKSGLLFANLVHAALEAFPKWCMAGAGCWLLLAAAGAPRRGTAPCAPRHIGANAQAVGARRWYNKSPHHQHSPWEGFSWRTSRHSSKTCNYPPSPMWRALIRLANSARFGLPRQVASLDDAITMVGLNQVRTLALASCMSGVFKDAPGVDAEAFWKESMAIAGYSQWLARTLGSNVQESWLAGFLVRLGELIIARKAPEQIPAIEQLPHHAGGRWERERTLLGFTEAQVTAELARRWRFPDTIVQALETAEDPVATTPFCRLGGILHVATLLAEIGLEEPMSP
ncbi:MAG: HDOD domain-containing protein, partial [Acidovorax sp.]